MNKLTAREKGALPITVGTSLAIEGLIKEPAKSFDRVLINVRTLFRNILDSVPTNVRNGLSAKEIMDAIWEDIEHIDTAVTQWGRGVVSLEWYYSDPKTLVKVLPDAIIRAPKTPLQIINQQLFERCLLEMKKEMGKHLVAYSPLPSGGRRTAILTHSPTDLLNRRDFSELYLLESHTGKVKRWGEFSSKLSADAAVGILPFNGFTVTLYGDGGALVYQFPRKAREMVLEVAKKYKWTTITKKDHILFSLKQIKNGVDRRLLVDIASKIKYW